MLERFRATWTALFAPVVRLLLRLGVSPDAVTVVGTLGVVAGALIFFPQGKLLAGVLFITAFVFSDMIDGAMARQSGRVSPFGAFLDSTLDRLGDAAIFGGLAMYYVGPGDEPALVALALYNLTMGSVTSYARARADALGMQAKVGVAERADRLVSILVITGLADIVNMLGAGDRALWAIPATLAVVAVAGQVDRGQRDLVVRQPGPGPPPPTRWLPLSP